MTNGRRLRKVHTSEKFLWRGKADAEDSAWRQANAENPQAAAQDPAPNTQDPTGLFLDQTRMAGHALPFAEIVNPSIGEAPDVIVRLALVGARSVIDPGNHRRLAEEVHLHVLDRGQAGLEQRISDVGQKSLLVADASIPLGIDEAARHQLVERCRVAIYLRLVPHPFQHQQFALARIGLLREYDTHAESQQKTATNRADRNRTNLTVTHHGRTRPPASPRGADVAKT